MKSNGHAKVILFTDSIYAIAATKTKASRATIEGCGGCKVLTVADTPIADLGNRMGQLITSPTHSISYADAVKTTTGDSAAESAFRFFSSRACITAMAESARRIPTYSAQLSPGLKSVRRYRRCWRAPPRLPARLSLSRFGRL